MNCARTNSEGGGAIIPPSRARWRGGGEADAPALQPYYRVEHAILTLGLSVYALAVYNVLAHHADRDRNCYPSIGRIARMLRIGRSTVLRSLRELETAGVIRVTPRFDARGHRTSNYYHLPPLGRGGVPLQDGGVPLQEQGCSATGTEQESVEQESLNKGERADSLLKYFAAGFRQRYGHAPRFTDQHLSDWSVRRSSESEALLRSKIDAWWIHQCPRLTGNRTFGAFLQWFDDIPTPIPATTGTSLSIAQKRTEMLHGTLLGRRLYAEAIGGATDHDSKQRTLVAFGYASDAKEADDVIQSCEVARP